MLYFTVQSTIFIFSQTLMLFIQNVYDSNKSNYVDVEQTQRRRTLEFSRMAIVCLIYTLGGAVLP